MEIKHWLIIIGVIVLFWFLFGGIFSDSGFYDYAPEGIEDYNVPPSNPYGN